MTFLRRLFQGQIPLVYTFWIGFILMRVVLATLVFYAQKFIPGVPAFIIAGLFLLYDVTILISTWRSAGTYLAQNAATMKRLWGYLAKLCVAALIIMIVVQLVTTAPKLLDDQPESGVRLIIHDEPEHGPMTESPKLDTAPTPINE